MKDYIKCVFSLCVVTTLMRYGFMATLIPVAMIVPVLLLLKWESKKVEEHPRWLGSSANDAPLSILDTDQQATVMDAKQKITKTDNDKFR